MTASGTFSPGMPIARADYVTTSPDEAAEIIRRMYFEHRPRFSGARTSGEFRLSSAAAGPLGADRAQLSVNFGVTAVPGDTLTCVLLHRGWVRIAAGQQDLRLRAGDGVIFLPGQRTEIDWSGIDATVLRIPVSTVREVAAEHTGSGRVRFTSMTPVSAAMNRHLRSVCALAGDILHDRAAAGTSPPAAGHLLRTVAAAVLAVFPNTALPRPGTRSGHASPRAIRRAAAYVEAHAAEPIGPAGIAAAAGIGVRALQYGFARHYGTSPTGYLHRVRIERAHRDLLAADPAGPAGPTVAAIAARWGYARTARFTARYRQAYGVPPAHTLRSS